MEKTLLDEIMTLKDVLPKKQRILCQYLALNYERVGVMTVAELARAAGVGTTTVMRLVQTLGYDSFSAFKRTLADVVLLKNTSSYRGQKTELCQHQGDREQRYLPLGGCRQPAHRGKPLYSLKY
ncbi:MAG: hypothetical protein V8S86_14000 [Eubacteriales bacterium]